MHLASGTLYNTLLHPVTTCLERERQTRRGWSEERVRGRVRNSEMVKNGEKESGAGDIHEKELVTAGCRGNSYHSSLFFSFPLTFCIFLLLVQRAATVLHQFICRCFILINNWLVHKLPENNVTISLSPR